MEQVWVEKWTEKMRLQQSTNTERNDQLFFFFNHILYIEVPVLALALETVSINKLHFFFFFRNLDIN